MYVAWEGGGGVGREMGGWRGRRHKGGWRRDREGREGWRRDRGGWRTGRKDGCREGMGGVGRGGIGW